MAEQAKSPGRTTRTGWLNLGLIGGMIAFFAFNQFVLTRFTQPELHTERTACAARSPSSAPLS